MSFDVILWRGLCAAVERFQQATIQYISRKYSIAVLGSAISVLQLFYNGSHTVLGTKSIHIFRK